MIQEEERKLSAAETVRLQLEKDISEGRLLPGSPLDEESLCARFEMSRTPVREALLHLAAVGLVTIVPRAGIYVARLSLTELMALVELLAELEAGCAKLATRRIDATEVAALKRVLRDSLACEKANDVQGYAHCNARFHEILYVACRNPAMAADIARIRARVRIYRRSVFENQVRIRRSRLDHTRIVEAIVDGDPDAAARFMLEHISGGLPDLSDMVSRASGTLLAADADYPGRQGHEQQRKDDLVALGGKAKPAPTARARQRLARAGEAR